MPSSSKAQHSFMEAVAHSPAFAKKAGVPQSVGKDFSTADKGRKFSKGGDMKASRGMGKIDASKMPKGVKKARRDDTDFAQYAEGGSVAKDDEAVLKRVHTMRLKARLKEAMQAKK